MSEDNYLLDAITLLTQKHRTKVHQEKNGISCVSVVDHKPLLQMLRDAVVGGIGSHAGSSSARERIPFDAGALALFDSINGQVNSWYSELPEPIEERYLWQRLGDWYRAYENRRRAGKVSDVEEHDTLRLVEGWRRSVEAMFDPPQTVEVTDACPMCGGRYAIDTKTGDRITALIIEYRELGLETLDKATGLCRSCLAVWRGSHGLREMRWDIDNPTIERPLTIGGITPAQIKTGITAAINVRNMKAVGTLIDLIAPVEPDTAADALTAVTDALESDRAAARYQREKAIRDEKEAERRRQDKSDTLTQKTA